VTIMRRGIWRALGCDGVINDLLGVVRGDSHSWVLGLDACWGLEDKKYDRMSWLDVVVFFLVG
jgi:hypothetical protein